MDWITVTCKDELVEAIGRVTEQALRDVEDHKVFTETSYLMRAVRVTGKAPWIHDLIGAIYRSVCDKAAAPDNDFGQYWFED